MLTAGPASVAYLASPNRDDTLVQFEAVLAKGGCLSHERKDCRALPSLSGYMEAAAQAPGFDEDRHLIHILQVKKPLLDGRPNEQ